MPTNPDPAVLDNPDPAIETAGETPPVPVLPEKFSWKSQLEPDYVNSPTMKIFPDTKEGFNSAVKSHLELQKMMGHEKVPIPKGPNDTAALEVFKRAFRIPEKPEGYGLADIEVPDSMKEMTFDKKMFSEVMHKQNLTPEQAKNLWQNYTEMSKQAYADVLKKYQDDMAQVVTQMRTEWGDAYDAKVGVGQMVINKFSENQEMNDFITASLVKDPRGIKFLAKIGEQFAENKIGDFKYQRHSLTPDEAAREIDSITSDPNHPYNNEKAPRAERDRAIDHVNSLYAVKMYKG